MSMSSVPWRSPARCCACFAIEDILPSIWQRWKTLDYRLSTGEREGSVDSLMATSCQRTSLTSEIELNFRVPGGLSADCQLPETDGSRCKIKPLPTMTTRRQQVS